MCHLRGTPSHENQPVVAFGRWINEEGREECVEPGKEEWKVCQAGKVECHFHTKLIGAGCQAVGQGLKMR